LRNAASRSARFQPKNSICVDGHARARAWPFAL
jgi:hypothetical protein